MSTGALSALQGSGEHCAHVNGSEQPLPLSALLAGGIIDTPDLHLLLSCVSKEGKEERCCCK